MKLLHTEEVATGVKIGVHANGYWYARIYAYDPATKKDSTQSKSTKIKYEGGRASNKNKARIKATDMAREVAPHIGKTANPFKRYLVKNIAKEWTDLVCELADENEALKIKGKRPKHEVYGGKPGRYWAVNRKETVQRNNRYLKEFWKTLPTQDIKKITNKQLDGLNEWAKTKDWSASQVIKLITQVRMVWRYARDKDFVDFIPSPKRPSENLKELSRRKLKQEEFEKMVSYTRERYEEPGISIRRRDSYLQFHCWLLICASTGIRPPSALKNAVRYKYYSIQKKKGKKELRFLVRPDEKELPQYTANVMPGAWKAFDMLEELYRARGMWEPEFVFAHTHSKKASSGSAGYEIGEPILCYKKQWANMLANTGLATKERAQNKRLAPYSLRGYLITKLMEQKHILRTSTIAHMTGTSERMINQAYEDKSTERAAERLAEELDDWPMDE
jgi:hypothetical protein